VNSDTPIVSPPPKQDRVGGWLLVFVIIQVITCVLAFRNLAAVPASFTVEGRNLQTAVPPFLAYVLFQVFALLVKCVVPIVGLVLLFRRSHQAPVFFKVFLSFVILEGLIALLAFPLLYPSLAAAFREAGDSLAPLEAARDAQFSSGLSKVGYGVVWLMYWFRSKKVARMFTVGVDEFSRVAT